MGYIEEPKNVDLSIAGGKLTPEDRKLIRAMIAKQRSANKVKRARAGVQASRTTRTRKASRTKTKA